MSRIYICDPNLRNFLGHHWETTFRIAGAAAECGLRPIVLANQAVVPASSGMPEVIGAFRRGYYDALQARSGFVVGRLEPPADRSPDLMRQAVRLVPVPAPSAFGDLTHALKGREPLRGDHLLFHTCTPAIAPDAARWLACQAAPPTVHLVLRCDERSCPGGPRDGFLLPLNALFPAVCAGHVRLYAETESLADYAAAGSGLPFSVLPAVAEALPPPAKQLGDPLCVAFLGDARWEKGFHRLPDLVEAVAAGRGPKDVRVCFLVQAHYNIPGGEPGMREARNRLGRFAPALVDLLLQPVEPAAYRTLLERADVVLLPYAQETYARRGSGILAEALAAARPVIVTSDTWMATQVDPSHGLALPFDGDLTSACLALLADYPRYREGALRRQPAAVDRHAPRALVARLLST